MMNPDEYQRNPFQKCNSCMEIVNNMRDCVKLLWKSSRMSNFVKKTDAFCREAEPESFQKLPEQHRGQESTRNNITHQS